MLNPKFSGAILLISVPISLLIGITDLNRVHNKVDEIYVEVGGTNANLSVELKVDFVRSSSLYRTNSSYRKYDEFLEGVKSAR